MNERLMLVSLQAWLGVRHWVFSPDDLTRRLTVFLLRFGIVPRDWFCPVLAFRTHVIIARMYWVRATCVRSLAAKPSSTGPVIYEAVVLRATIPLAKMR